MGNCLVTKLKAAVNNPNLPILETMQQFTLDAIAASGNSSMTDAQKLALNHFFLQIGAISNNGIYAKLEVLCLPFIGGTKSGALTDFSKNSISPTNIDSQVSFVNGGFLASTGKNIADYYLTNTIAENLFVLMIGTINDTKLLNSGLKNENSVTLTLSKNNTNNRFIINISPYDQYTNYLYANVVDIVSFKGGSFAINGNAATCYVLGDGEITKKTTTFSSGEGGYTINRLTPKSGTVNNAPYTYAIGAGITEAEQLKFMQEMKTLLDAFE